METLRHANAEPGQGVDLSWSLYPLGHHGKPKPPGDVDDAGDEHGVAGAVVDAADELAIDLQASDRQVLEVHEGAEAGTEVVESNPAAVGAQPVGQAARGVEVGDGRGLGDLEAEPAGRHAGGGEPILDEITEVLVLQGSAGDVDVE